MFVDTNILIYASDPKSHFHDRALDLIARHSDNAALCINDVVFAEFSAIFDSVEDAADVLERSSIQQVRSSRESLFRASRAYTAYRRSGGTKTSPLPDFFIGADAVTAGVPLLTNDTARYVTYFPDLEIISP